MEKGSLQKKKKKKKKQKEYPYETANICNIFSKIQAD